MKAAAKGSDFWTAVVAEARTGTKPHAAVAAKYGVTEAALKYHFYKARKPARAASKRVTMLPVRVGSEARLFSVETEGGLRVRFAEGCDPAYVAAVIAKLR